MWKSATSVLVAIGLLLLSGLPSLPGGGLGVVADLAVPFTTPIPARPIFFRSEEVGQNAAGAPNCGKSFCEKFENCCGNGCCPPGSTCWADGKGCCPNGATCIEPTVSWLAATASHCSPFVRMWASSLCCPADAPYETSVEGFGSGCFAFATPTYEQAFGPPRTTTDDWVPTEVTSSFATEIPRLPPDTQGLTITIQEIAVVTHLPRSNPGDTAASALPNDPEVPQAERFSLDTTTVTATIDEPCTTSVVTVHTTIYATLTSNASIHTSISTDVTTTVLQTTTQTFEAPSSLLVEPTATSSNGTNTTITSTSTTTVRTITQTLERPSVSSDGDVTFNLTATSSTSLASTSSASNATVTSQQTGSSSARPVVTVTSTATRNSSTSVSLCFDRDRATHTPCSATAVSPTTGTTGGFRYTGPVVSNINSASRAGNSAFALMLLLAAFVVQF